MTTREPCSIGEITMGTLPAVCDQSLQLVMEQVGDQLRELTLLRKTIDQKIAILKRTINGLESLYGSELPPRPEEVASGERRRGITNACRVVLDLAEAPLTSREVYAILQERFPALVRRPDDHHASLLTMLSRLVRYGEAETFLQDGDRFWRKRQQPDARQIGRSGS